MSATVAENKFAMFTFQDLLEAAQSKRERAQSTAPSWNLLISVTEGLAGTSDVMGELLKQGRTWQLESVSIQGFRGVPNSNPLTLVFEPAPGITVLHGPNGAGKSSVSDAIDLCLSGKLSNLRSKTGGNAPLWEPIHLFRDAPSADISTVLIANDSRLELKLTLNAKGEVDSHTATISDTLGEREVKIDDAWGAAISSHQPVFAYASLERKVQLSKDLAQYFEGLLALGGCFSALEEEISLRSSSSTSALTRWNIAKAEALRSLAAVDEEAKQDGRLPELEPTSDASVDQDINEWLEVNHLNESGVRTPILPSDTLSQLTACASKTLSSIGDLENARGSFELQLQPFLESLHSESQKLPAELDKCPVCLTVKPDWLSTLEDTVERGRAIDAYRQSATSAIKALADLTVSHLEPILEAMAREDNESPFASEYALARGAVDSMNQSRQNRIDLQSEVLGATRQLAEWILSESAADFISEALARADALKQWNIKRAATMSDFINVWKVDGETAGRASDWTAASQRLEDLRKHLRGQRSAALNDRAGIRIEKLLSDANLRLKDIGVLATKASMELVDENDNAVDLGMLSAGQRNAVLLAPLLSSSDSGPFGFLILDDPVHAFDELRIDRLSSALIELAKHRRVIVLTHDERLREHLSSLAVTADTREVVRSSSDGVVQVSDTSHFSTELLTDAHNILRIALEESGSTASITDEVRQLCRIALDAALRAFTLKNAHAAGRDVTVDLNALDACMTTRRRFSAAEKFWDTSQGNNPVTRASVECDRSLDDWNSAIHGNPAKTDITAEEIKQARRACQILNRAA